MGGAIRFEIRDMTGFSISSTLKERTRHFGKEGLTVAAPRQQKTENLIMTPITRDPELERFGD